jgi:hypothetical protein
MPITLDYAYDSCNELTHPRYSHALLCLICDAEKSEGYETTERIE